MDLELEFFFSFVFWRVSPMWLHQSWKVWKKVSHLNPGLEPCAATTAAHAHPSGKAWRFLTTSRSFCPSNNATIDRFSMCMCPYAIYLVWLEWCAKFPYLFIFYYFQRADRYLNSKFSALRIFLQLVLSRPVLVGILTSAHNLLLRSICRWKTELPLSQSGLPQGLRRWKDIIDEEEFVIVIVF